MCFLVLTDAIKIFLVIIVVKVLWFISCMIYFVHMLDSVKGMEYMN